MDEETKKEIQEHILRDSLAEQSAYDAYKSWLGRNAGNEDYETAFVAGYLAAMRPSGERHARDEAKNR